MLGWALLIAVLPLGLEWSAPEGCPTAREVESEIEGLLARSIPSPTVIATASVSGPPWRGHLMVGGERRSLTGESCEAVAKGAALILAMHLESLPVDPPPTTVDTATSAPPVIRAEVPRPADPPLFRGIFGARIVGDLGGLGGPAPGLGIDLGFALGRWRALVTGTLLLPRTQDLGGGAESAHGLYALGLRGCGDLPLAGPLTWFGCGLAELGAITGASQGVAQPASANALWIAGGVEVGPSFVLGDRWILALPVSLLVPGQRPRFVVEPFGEVHRPGPVVVRLSVSIEARWP